MNILSKQSKVGQAVFFFGFNENIYQRWSNGGRRCDTISRKTGGTQADGVTKQTCKGLRTENVFLDHEKEPRLDATLRK